jgi:STE24 endopeptidase
MTAELLFLLIVAIVVLGFLLDLVLDYLNFTTLGKELPDFLEGIYEPEKYSEQQNYQRVNYRFGLISGVFSFLLILGMLLFNGFAFLDHLVRTISSSPILQALMFFGIIGFAADLLTTPFDIYHTFVIEQRFGFNTTTPGTYVLDKLKSWLLAVVIGGGLLALIVVVYEKTGDYFWLIVWGIITLFSVFVSYFYTTLILPLFNKLTPLEDGELREAIEAFAWKAKFNLRNIYIMDGSKRSTKGNAYFSGFGRQKKIVLFDTLIKEHTTEELVAVLAHEIGHYKKKHIPKGMILSVLQTGVLLYIFSLLVGSPLLSASLGSPETGFHMGLLAFGILYSPVSEIISIGMNVISRRYEFQADEFAAQKSGSKNLQEALKKLSSKNLTNLQPHPLYVFVHYSHPPLAERLQALQKFDA